MKKKKLILSFIIVIILILIGLVIAMKLLYKNDNKNIVKNTEKEVISDKIVSNILFSDIEYYYDGTNTTVFMNVTNNNAKTVVLGDFIAIIYDKNDNLIEKFEPTTKYELKKNETMELEFYYPKDLTNANKMEIELPNLQIIE